MSKLLSENPTISNLISEILSLEGTIRKTQDDLYNLRDKLRAEVQRLSPELFDKNNQNSYPVVFVQTPGESLYRLTLSGTMHGLFIEEVPVVKVA